MPGFPACQIRTHHKDTHGSFFARALLNPLMSRWSARRRARSIDGFAPKKNDDSEGEKGEASPGVTGAAAAASPGGRGAG